MKILISGFNYYALNCVHIKAVKKVVQRLILLNKNSTARVIDLVYFIKKDQTLCLVHKPNRSLCKTRLKL